MKRLIPAVLLSLATGAFAAAPLYRWVDDKGNVEYRDTPPPQSAKKVEERRVVTSTIETSAPSYSVQQAAKNFPVTLWAYDCGKPCTDARAHLVRRGVPYAEKDPQSDLQAFKKLTGDTNVPVLFVGSTRLTGYEASGWDSALDNAGYPASAPPSAAKPAPKPAAAQKPAPPAQQAAAPATPPEGQAQETPPPPQQPGGRPGLPANK